MEVSTTNNNNNIELVKPDEEPSNEATGEGSTKSAGEMSLADCNNNTISNNNNYMIKKGCSPSPPLVLIESADEQQQQHKRELRMSTSESVAQSESGDSGCKSGSIDLNLLHKQMALIEATDSAEMELVMRLINEKFPTVKINFFAGRDKNNNNNQNNTHSDMSSDPNESSSSNDVETTNGPASSMMMNGNGSSSSSSRRLSSTSIRTATSVDGAGLLNMMAIERQESRDSGFWSVSKCSFESMKSLSLTDSSNSNG